MHIKILKTDLLKNKVISAVLFVFIALAALLIASGTNMIAELTNSLNALFAKSQAPHFVQMHSGPIDHAEINAFATENSLVKDHQIVEMIHIDGGSIDFGHTGPMETNSLMDHYFVKQNDSFDLLLNLQSEVIRVSQGEIAVPIYFMQKENISLGDKITIAAKDFHTEFTVVDFVRDVQMNPSIIHSKRFVVHEADLHFLKKNLGQVEYLIEFLLTDTAKLRVFRNAYQTTNLPKKGPSLDYSLFKTLNAITEGMVSAVIIFVSILLNMIALLCIRFTILTAIEKDYREIGIMKAIGIALSDIKKIYLLKYIVIAAAASIAGYTASLYLNRLFTANMILYMGSGPKSQLLKMTPFLAVMCIFFMVVLFCLFILRRFNTISAVDALRLQNKSRLKKNKNYFSLHRNVFLNVPIYLGLRDIIARFNIYRLLFFTFFVCAFMIIVPVNFLNTIQSPDFIKYMGVERSDIRIDLQQTDDAGIIFEKMITEIANDTEVEKFAPLVTSQFKMIHHDGVEEVISIETGDFQIFYLEYLSGRAPARNHEIALSYMNSEEFEKKVGESLLLAAGGEEIEMVVSGIYQDITNGGRTAKAVLPPNDDQVLSYKVSVDVKPHIDIDQKIAEYNKKFHPGKVTDVKGYLKQTFGNTIDQVRIFTIAAIVIAISISILFTSLFIKMLVARDHSQIAIMKSIGFSLNDIRMQYVTRMIVVLMMGIVLGTIVANSAGQKLISVLLSFIGISEINFVIDPVKAYIICPFILIATVAVTTLLSIVSIEKASIANIGA